MFDSRTAFVSSLFFAFLFFPIYYSRETYCYPVILFLTSFSLYCLWHILFAERLKPEHLLGSVLGFAALSASHMGCLMVPVTLAALVFIFFVYVFFVKRDDDKAKRWFFGGLSLGLALMLISPLAIRYVLYNTAHVGGSEYSLFVIINDVVTKIFMGDRPVFAILAWILFDAGLVSMFRSGATDRRLLGAATILSLVLLAYATTRTQYLSARYFSPVAPLIIIAFGVGLSTIGSWVERFFKKVKPGIVAFTLTVLLVGYSFVFYVVPMYLLKHREAIDFEGVAEWLNENLEPGTPYLWCSGYLLRFVPGFYPTHGLIAVCPYVHADGPEELEVLEERQRHFVWRFPVSAYLNGFGHNLTDVEAGEWPWPKGYYRQHAEIISPTLSLLVERGIFPWEPGRKLDRANKVIDIFYNRPEDAVILAKELGHSVYCDFSAWQIARVSGDVQGLWAEYAHAIEGTFSLLPLVNLQDRDVTGTLELVVSVLSAQDLRHTFSVSAKGSTLAVQELAHGVFMPINVSCTIKKGKTLMLQLNAAASKHVSAKALFVYSANFIESSDSEVDTEKPTF
ncbi:MAG: hypothetical protein GX811_12405 [Lentisphaerae bacterium]|nr:hypothetical protein [Lentisphaerota bacterium]